MSHKEKLIARKNKPKAYSVCVGPSIPTQIRGSLLEMEKSNMFPDMMKNESSKFCKAVEDPEEIQGNVPFKKVIARAAQEKLKKESAFFQSVCEN